MADTDRSETAETMWRQLAERAIGRGIETLDSRSAEGLPIRPLYPRISADPHQPWRSQPAWSVAQRIDHPDPEAANAQALSDLEGGAHSLVLVDPASPYARGFGVCGQVGHLDLLFDKVELDLIGLRIDAGTGTQAALEAIAALVVGRRLTSAALDVDIGFDPIGWRARLGHGVEDDPGPILDRRAKAGLGGTVFLADGRPWHEAGAGEAQELAAVLATALAYLRRQETLGLDAARRNIAVLLAADADLFLGLAKFRAMRRLWARVEAACGVEPAPLCLHAETSWRMMARYDPWTNVMRATAATFAAGLGGADSIAVLPFTLPFGLPDAAARRLARNVQRVLLDEAHLAGVEDPAAGAGGFEALTDMLCVEAWRLFQQIEGEGGIARSIATGGLKARVAETAAGRGAEIRTLRQAIIGTSRFASLAPQNLAVLDVPAMPALSHEPHALPAHRDAEPFEALRDRAEALAASGHRPRVFLATLGAPADYGRRADEAANFFAAAGLSAGVTGTARGVDELAADFAASETDIACLCGTDDAYATLGIAMAQALRRAGARRVMCVGSALPPLPDEDIDVVVCDGCDALQILTDTLDTWSA